ncbi:MAG TPA: enoyl-CoA hydratase-related protein [Pirellulaceae bacterium]|nr:enoyl-CoA hydratase-related protein [Pirellulaceae bacterium]
MNRSASDVPQSNFETGVRFEWIEPGIAALRFDMPGKSANVMTATMLNDLDRALNALDQQTDLRGLILISAKPRVFVAGADLTAIAQTLDWPDDEIIRFCRRGQEMFERLRKFAAASIAVIDGACLGGGLELALACDYRIATTADKSILGLPEVKLGLIPGWAGTVRLPRLVGLRRAGELLTSARILTSREALDVGLVDRWCPVENALAEALELARQVFDSEELRQRRLAQASPIEIPSAEHERLNAEMSAAIDRHPELYPLAPRVVWEQVSHSASLDFESACRSEALAMCRVWGSAPSRGLLNVYFMGEHNKKNPGRVDMTQPTRPINSIGIVGLGVMGQSIGRVIAAKSTTVLGWDEQSAARDRFQAPWEAAIAGLWGV